MVVAFKNTEIPIVSSYQAVLALLKALKANMEKLVVYAIESRSFDGVDRRYFKSKMVLRDQRTTQGHSIEISVIDGIIIAILAKCPIFVTEEVFKQHHEEVEREERDYLTAQAQHNFNTLTSKGAKIM